MMLLFAMKPLCPTHVVLRTASVLRTAKSINIVQFMRWSRFAPTHVGCPTAGGTAYSKCINMALS